MSSHDPSIIERVKKLLALSSSSEPHEAALALQMAQKLMQQHNLTAEQVEVGEIKSEALRSIATKSKAKRWELRLMNGIAEAFGIGLMFQGGMSFVTDSRMYGSWLFIGPKAEVAAARLGFGTRRSTFDSAAPTHPRQYASTSSVLSARRIHGSGEQAHAVGGGVREGARGAGGAEGAAGRVPGTARQPPGEPARAGRAARSSRRCATWTSSRLCRRSMTLRGASSRSGSGGTEHNRSTMSSAPVPLGPGA